MKNNSKNPDDNLHYVYLIVDCKKVQFQKFSATP